MRSHSAATSCITCEENSRHLPAPRNARHRVQMSGDLGLNPAQKGFEASCYHRSLEPFMARGRALRAAGITERHAIDSARLADIRSGRLRMPRGPAMLASLFADKDDFDPRSRPEQSTMLHVIYLPYATESSSGISAAPAKDRPWLMYGGKPWAHVMLP